MGWADRIGRRIKLRDLHVLQSVVQSGSMTKAARDLAVSIPVVSKSIADLEHTVGFRLLDRGPQGVEPTIYGRALLARSHAAFQELRQGIDDIEFLADPNGGELRLGCTEVTAAGPAFSIIDRLTKKFPRMVFNVATGELSGLYRDLAARNIELVMSGITEVPSEEFVVEHLFEDSLVVAAGANSPWTRRRKIALSELVNEPWALPPMDSGPGILTLEAFRASGLEPPRASVVAVSLNLRNRLLATGRFLTMLAGYALTSEGKYPQLKALPVKMPNLQRSTVIVTLRNRTLSPLAELFIQAARELAKPLPRKS